MKIDVYDLSIGFISGDISSVYSRNNGLRPDFPDDSVGFTCGTLIDSLEEIGDE